MSNILAENITLEFIDRTSEGKLKYTALLIYKTWHSIPVLLWKEVEWEGQEACTGALPLQGYIQSFATLLSLC